MEERERTKCRIGFRQLLCDNCERFRASSALSMNAPSPIANRKRATISVDLGELREPFLSACADSEVRIGEAVRGLVAAALRGEGQSVLRSEDAPVASTRSRQRNADTARPGRARTGVYERQIKKITVRLGASEALLVSELAEREGFATSRWIAALVRSRLVAEPQLNRAEIQALADANGQLGAIGRNVNQIARALNSLEHPAMAYDKEVLEDLREALKAHRDAISKLILANTERWQVEKAAKR